MSKLNDGLPPEALLPFDSISFGCRAVGALSKKWETMAVKNGDGWRYMSNCREATSRCYSYMCKRDDGNVTVYWEPFWLKQPWIRVDIEVGNLGLRAIEIPLLLGAIIGYQQARDEAYVRAFDAKLDIGADFYDVRKGIYRASWCDELDYDGQEERTPGTLYMGDRGTERVMVYDKAKEARQRETGEVFAFLDVPCTRIEKTVKLSGSYTWYNFLTYAAPKFNPFKNIIFFDTEGLGRQLRYQKGMHNLVRKVNREKKLRGKNGAWARKVDKRIQSRKNNYLEQLWLTRLDAWMKPIKRLGPCWPIVVKPKARRFPAA